MFTPREMRLPGPRVGRGSSRLNDVLRAGQNVCGTGADAEHEVQLDSDQQELMRRMYRKTQEKLRNCVQARLDKDEEIEVLRQKLKACEDRLYPQANQLQQVLKKNAKMKK